MTELLHQPYPFEATRERGLARLNAFLPHAGKDYASGRNYDRGSFKTNSVSALSPFLSRRMITEKEVVDKVLEHHSLKESESYVKEVCWRTYWKGWLEMRPEIWRYYLEGVKVQHLRLEEDLRLQDLYSKAITGSTPLTAFNHWVKELTQFGYLHNHARMWVAGIWIYELGLPWELGASFFASHLLDGDPASNTLSWRWVAGLHTQGKRYVPGAGNIHTFTEGRFGSSEALSPAETGPSFEILPDPKLLSFPPRPQQSDILVLCMEDLGLDLPKAWCEGLKKVVIVSSLDSDGPLGWEPSEKVLHFNHQALEDAATRWGRVAEVERIEGADLETWWKQIPQDRVAMPRTPVGPSCDYLNGLWSETGARPQMWVRDWDRNLWPHSKAGFFKFWKQVNLFLAGERVDIPS